MVWSAYLWVTLPNSSIYMTKQQVATSLKKIDDKDQRTSACWWVMVTPPPPPSRQIFQLTDFLSTVYDLLQEKSLMVKHDMKKYNE